MKSLILCTLALLLAHSASALTVLDSSGQPMENGLFVSFGSTVQMAPMAKNFTVLNDGSTPVTNLGFALSERGDFVLEAPAVNSLAVGERASLTLTYVPLIGQSANTKLQISVANAVVHELHLAASTEVRNLDIKIEEVGGAEITPLSPAVDFGSARIGSVTVRTFRITNLGDHPLSNLSAYVQSQPSSPWWGYYQLSDFRSVLQGSGPLAPGASRLMQVEFWPDDTSTTTASVVVSASNVATHRTVALTGKGTAEVSGAWRLGGLYYRLGDGAPAGTEVREGVYGDHSIGQPEAERWKYTVPAPPSLTANVSTLATGAASLIAYPISLRFYQPYYPFTNAPPLTPSAVPAVPKHVDGKAMEFGGGSFLSRADLKLPSSDNVGVELWLKAAAVTGSQCIAMVGESADEGFGLYLENDRVQARAGSGRVLGTTSVVPGQWHHLVLVMKAGVLTLYQDQTAEGSLTGATLPALVKGFGLGATVTGGEPLSGAVDELRLFEVGTNFDPHQDLLPTAKPRIKSSKALVNLDSTMLGKTSSARLSLANEGKAALQITGIAIAGDHPGDFTVSVTAGHLPLDTPDEVEPNGFVLSANPISPVPILSVYPGYLCRLAINFTPSTPGLRTATLRVTSNDPANPVLEIPLSGMGEPAKARLQLSDFSGNWGTVLTNSSRWLSLSLSNIGSADLTGLSAAVLGPHAADITLGTVPASLAGGGSVSLGIDVRPQAGPRLATLRLTSDDAERPAIDIPLFGRGEIPVPEIAVSNGMTSQDLPNGAELNFGATFANFRQVGIPVRISSPGTKALAVSRFEITGPDAADFAMTWNSSYTLPGGLPDHSNTEVNLVFTPSAAGKRTATLIIESDDADEGSYAIQLTGEGLPPAAELHLTDDTGSATYPVGTSFIRLGTAVVRGFREAGAVLPSRSLKLRNNGNAALSGATLTFEGPHAGDFTATMADILSNAVGEVIVSFDPTTTGARSAVLRMKAPGLDFQIPVGGTGAYGEKASLTPDLPADWVTTAMLPLENGSVLVAGYAGPIDRALFAIKLIGNGTVIDEDEYPLPQFDHYTNAPIRAFSLGKDGSVYAAGEFTRAFVADASGTVAAEVAAQGVTRLCRGTAAPRDFTSPTGDLSGRAVVALPDGKIMVGGEGTLGGRSRLARLNSDGTLDSSFINPALDGAVNALALQDDGRLLVGGDFNYQSGQLILVGSSNNGLFRLHANGSVDTSFMNPGLHQVTSIVAHGDHIAFGGVVRMYWLYTQVLGSAAISQPINYTLQPAAYLTGRDGVQIGSNFIPSEKPQVALLPGGRMVVTVDGSGIAILRDYSLPQESMRSTFSGKVNALIAQPDGKILLGGEGLSFQSSTQSNGGFVQLDDQLQPQTKQPMPGNDGLDLIDFGDDPQGSEPIVEVPDSSISVIQGPDAAAFTVVNSDVARLTDAGVTLPVRVKFSPLHAGLHKAVLAINNEFEIGLQGGEEVAPPTPAPEVVLVHRIKGQVLENDGTMDFGLSRAGKEIWGPWLLKNVGNTAIRKPLIIEITGPDAADFRVGQRPQYPLRAKAMTPLFVTFTPRADGTETRTAQLTLRREGSEAFVIQLTGSVPLAPVFTTHPLDALAAVGSSHSLSAEVSSSGPIAWQWLKNDKRVRGASSSTLSLMPLKLQDAGTYTARARAMGMSALSQPAQLGVVDTSPRNVTAPLGGAVVLECEAAGPRLTFAWMKDGRPLAAAPGQAGERSRRLTLDAVNQAQIGTYTCLVSLGSLTLESGPQRLELVRVPSFIAPLPDLTLYVAEAANLQLMATDAARYTARGLPPGLRLDAVTGSISGQPMSPGIFRVSYTAVNPAGSSQPLQQVITVAPLPVRMTGRFYGVFERDNPVTSGRGGVTDFVVSSSGAFTGRLRFGSASNEKVRVVFGKLIVGREGAVPVGVADLTPAPGESFTLIVRGDEAPSQFSWVTAEGYNQGNPYRVRTQPTPGLVGSYDTVLSKTAVEGVVWEGQMKITRSSSGILSWSGKLAPEDGGVVTVGSSPIVTDAGHDHGVIYQLVRQPSGSFSALGSLGFEPLGDGAHASAWFTYSDEVVQPTGGIILGYGASNYPF